MRRAMIPSLMFSLLLVTGCGFGSNQSTGDADPTNATSQANGLTDSVSDDKPDDEPALTGQELKTLYLTTVCKLYTEPACITAQQESCPAHIAFSQLSDCTKFMTETASTCVGLAGSFAANKTDVLECVDQISNTDCAATPACDASGNRIDVVDRCAKVSQLIASCDPDIDTGL